MLTRECERVLKQNVFRFLISLFCLSEFEWVKEEDTRQSGIIVGINNQIVIKTSFKRKSNRKITKTNWIHSALQCQSLQRECKLNI